MLRLLLASTVAVLATHALPTLPLAWTGALALGLAALPTPWRPVLLALAVGYAGTPCAAGQRWQWDGVEFTVLNGPANAVGLRSPDNNGACVLRIATGNFAALLLADIERDAEARLLREAPAQLKADVLLAPHHGSRTSSTSAFVQAVNPEVVIFSAGYANSCCHPRAEVVQRYLDLGSAAHLTGHEGALTLRVDPITGVGPVQAWRREQPRYWWAPVLPVPE